MGRSRSSETHAYAWIKQALKRFGFNTGNPNRNPAGEVYTQHECNGHEDLRTGLDGDVPENVVRLSARAFWLIEAKSDPKELAKAFKEAKKDYADKINGNSRQIKVRFATGVAGSDEDGYSAKTAYLDSNGVWKEVTLSGQPIRRLLRKTECLSVMGKDTADIARQEMTARQVVELSQRINRILHEASVEKEKRASTVAVLLLALWDFPELRLDKDPDVFVQDINVRAEQIFKDSDKEHLWKQIHNAGQPPVSEKTDTDRRRHSDS